MSKTKVLSPLLCLFAIAATANADWTDEAFPIKHHDFGTVAVAAKTEFRFPVVNTLGSTMHIRSVRASCGCTTPTVETPYISPNQTGYIHAKFNTHTFKGKKGATLTVVVDQPVYSEIRLRVDGYIRSDIVVSPGAIDFGRVEQGKPATQSTKLYYAGRDSWEIVDVQSNRPWLIPEVKEIERGGGRVTYELAVGMREDASGTFQDELVVVTNDNAKPRFPIRVTGQVESALSISPQAIALGSVKPGETIRQKLVVIGRQPFTIASIQADGWTVNTNATSDARKTHFLIAEFTATGDKTGPQKVNLQIEGGGSESISASAIMTADVRAQ